MNQSTPFLFFEFDASLFQKYYGSGINTPGIYAIPEDETEPSAPSPEEMEQMYNEMQNSADGGEENDEDSALVQRKENQENISNAITSQPDIPLPQMSADEQQAYEQEIQPIKKVFLLNKLKKLQTRLNDNSMSDDDLNLVLKYGPYLTYPTLVRLAITAINNLRNSPQVKNGGQGEEYPPAAENQQDPNMVPYTGDDVNVATQFI